MKKVVYNACFGGFSISKKCAQFMADRGNTEAIDMIDNVGERWHGRLWDTPRHDAILIMAVEALGSEASDDMSDLAVRELKGNRYIIDEYDGSESVVEPHNIQWIKI